MYGSKFVLLPQIHFIALLVDFPRSGSRMVNIGLLEGAGLLWQKGNAENQSSR